ncbi:MAG: DUF4465 domain-containing protein [Bacteroidales bacterium]|nr:DUF4465 domain-containing protein [Bacteroidales bacterium]
MKYLSIFGILCLSVLLVQCHPCIPGEPEPFLITFEHAEAASLVNSTYGDNLYDGSYVPYRDQETGLNFSYHFTSQSFDGYEFTTWDGIVLSQMNDTQTPGYLNQCSVFYKDPETGKGGHNRSGTFALVYIGEEEASMYFEDPNTEMVFHTVFITNSTYTALSMLHGDAFTKAFSYEDQDWLKLTFTGYSKEGHLTGTVAYYLADFRTSTSPGVTTTWQKVDLTPLGRVNKVAFSLESTDMGDWGMNTPAYFCMDNLIVSEFFVL